MTTTQEKPVQESLLVPERPKLKFKVVDVASIVSEPWGSPPDDALIRNVGLIGVMQPIQLTETDDSRYRIREGRRRFQAAVANGLDAVPAVIVTNAEALGAGIHATELVNAFSSQNPVMDLDAIENIQLATQEDDLIEVARMTCVPLNVIKKRARLRALIGELRDAAREGKIPTPVVEAAARLDISTQQKLLEPLRANDKLVMNDVAAVKKTTVRSHERSLPGLEEGSQILGELQKLRGRAFLEWGACDIVETLDQAIAQVEEKVGSEA